MKTGINEQLVGRISLLFCWGLILLLCTFSCRPASKQADGQQLASTYCGSCHAKPEPGDLPEFTWESTILPRMGNRLGIYTTEYSRAAALALDERNDNHKLADIYPANAALTEEEWLAIRTYYLDNAPEQLEIAAPPAVETTPLFQARFPTAFYAPPAGTMLELLPDNQGVLYGDANKNQLVAFDTSLQIVGQVKVGEGPTAYRQYEQEAYFSVIGSFSPTDAPLGSVWKVEPGGKARPIIQHLQRPTDVKVVDIWGDGSPELLIPEYGKESGRLAYWTEQPDGSWTPTVLANRPGAIKCIPVDLNQDGQLEFVALFGQGDERIEVFSLDLRGKYTARTVLQFPPSYGSSSLDTVDWNDDGRIDLVYTAGDNADYHPVLKPYHGIYIFTQNSAGGFDQAEFLPLHGAYAAKVADFDLDGDLDIAAIAFFPDFEEELPSGIVYFEQLPQAEFKMSRLKGAQHGRWLRLSAADYDADGDIDLAASSLAFETLPDRGWVDSWVRQGIPFVLWENTLLLR